MLKSCISLVFGFVKADSHRVVFPPHRPTDSTVTLMTVCGIRGKILRTAIAFTHAHSELAVITILGYSLLGFVL